MEQPLFHNHEALVRRPIERRDEPCAGGQDPKFYWRGPCLIDVTEPSREGPRPRRWVEATVLANILLDDKNPDADRLIGLLGYEMARHGERPLGMFERCFELLELWHNRQELGPRAFISGALISGVWGRPVDLDYTKMVSLSYALYNVLLAWEHDQAWLTPDQRTFLSDPQLETRQTEAQRIATAQDEIDFGYDAWD